LTSNEGSSWGLRCLLTRIDDARRRLYRKDSEAAMANPLSGLTPALDVLARSTEVLPATGQAVEDLQRPDRDEVEDDTLVGDDARADTLIEAPNQEVYVATPPLPRQRQKVYRYFLDGSRRLYFIGTALEHDRSTPIQIAQLGAAIVRRGADGRMHRAQSKRKLLLMLARSQVSDAVWTQLEAVAAGWQTVDMALQDIGEADDLNRTPTSREDWRNRGGGKANWYMHQLEMELALGLGQRTESDWLVIDGSIRFENILRSPPPYIIGVVKSFSKRQEFTLGHGPRAHRYTLFRLLAGLPSEHRTCAFSAYRGQLAFWYVRLREQGEVEYPMMGVIKVELPNPSGEAVGSELIDLLSRALVAEKTVSPHGLDRRWHCHLYPIYLAEQVVKNSMLSGEVLRAAIRWPGTSTT
jgi:hypothetical protein